MTQQRRNFVFETGPRGLLFWLPVIYLLVAQFPGSYAPMRAGLDGSWIIGINLLARSPLLGRDVVFTYGPWGYVLFPLPVGPNLAYAAAFWLVIHAIFAALVIHLRFRLRSHGQYLCFVAMYMIAGATGLPYEYHLLLVESLLIALAVREKWGWYTAAPAAGLLAAVYLFMKLSLGMAAGFLFVGAVSAWLIRRVPGSARAIGAWVAAWGLTFAVLAAVLLRSSDTLVRWLQASRDLAGEFGVAMSTVGPTEFLILGFLALVVMERLLERHARSCPDVTVMCAVGLLFAFKHGFARQDRHILAFFPYALGLASTLVAWTTLRPRWRTEGLTCVLILGLLMPAAVHYDPSTVRGFPGFLLGRDGCRRLVSLLRLNRTERELRTQGERALAAEVLSPEMARESAAAATVGIVPWEISMVPANNLSWRPSTVMQTYTAYTAFLDRLNADHFRGPQAPELLLVEYADIDGRNPIQAAPDTWMAIRENYEPGQGPDRRGRLLLRKRAEPQPLLLKKSASDVFPVGQWVNVPARPQALEARMELHLNPVGKLARAIYRIPPLSIELETEDGAVHPYRLVASTASNGIWIGSLVTNVRELRDWLQGVPGVRVLRFRIVGDGAVYYRNGIRIAWLSSPSADSPEVPPSMPVQ